MRVQCRANLFPQSGCKTVTCLTASVFRTGSRKEVQKRLLQNTRDPKLLCLPVEEASPSTAMMPYIRQRPTVELSARHARPNQDRDQLAHLARRQSHCGVPTCPLPRAHQLLQAVLPLFSAKQLPPRTRTGHKNKTLTPEARGILLV